MVILETGAIESSELFLRRRSSPGLPYCSSLEELTRGLHFYQSANLICRFRYLCEFVRAWFKCKGNDSGYVSSQKLIFRLLILLCEFVRTYHVGERELSRAIASVKFSIENRLHRMSNEALHTKRVMNISGIQAMLQQYQDVPTEVKYAPSREDKLSSLPFNVLETVVRSLTNPRDICSLSETCSDIRVACTQENVWKSLAIFHFGYTRSHVVQRVNGCSWYKTVAKLYGTHKLREVYADYVCYYPKHNSLSWIGDHWKIHNCKCDCSPEYITPQQLVKFLD